MTELEHIAAKIEAGIASQEHGDPAMRKLCLNILEQLRSTPLKKESSNRQFAGNPGKEEQIRIEFIQGAQKIGGALAIQHFDAETEYPGNQFFQNLIRNGLSSIGREIAANYARKLYPELRHLRDNGEKPPRNRPRFQTGKRFYNFILKNYGDRFELAPVMEAETYRSAFIYYDEEKKRYIEEFSFDSAESADAMHGAWERFIAKKTARCPVAYCLTVNHDAADGCSVSPISHVLFSEKDSRTVNPDGSSSEKRIFRSVFEADRVRIVLQKELDNKSGKKVPEQSREKTLDGPIKPEIIKRVVPEQNMPQVCESTIYPPKKGRTV